MTHLDQMIADSLAQSSDTVVHQLASEVTKLRADLNKMTDERNAWRTGEADRMHEADKRRGELDAARAEIADLKRGGVVVPELLAETTLALIAIDWPNRTIDIIATARNIREWFRKSARTIPADRVLGEGDRVVGREEWMYLAALERYARKHGPESIQDVIGCLDHLRAQPTQELAP